MKKMGIAIVALLCIYTSAFAQKKVSIDSVKNYLGQQVTVCSKVFGVKALEKITFINVGAAFPNAPLTLVIRAKDYANFTELPEKRYANKQICVTGTIADFKGKLQIMVTKPSDIVVEK
jgi:hypothetical protein